MFSSKLPDVGTTIFSTMTALANEVGAVNLSQGFPDYPVDPSLADLLAKAVQDGFNQYAPMPGLLSLREAVAAKYWSMFSITVDPVHELTITPGGTAALATAIATVVRPGHEVIVFEPCYDSYAPAVRLNGGIVVPSVLAAPLYRPDWDHVRSLVSDRTAMIIVNSPHNPCGSTLTSDDLNELADICEGSNIIVLSDEVYELITYDGAVHNSVLAHARLRERSFVITSFGKTFHITGWKVGCCAAPQHLTSEFRKAHQFISFCVNTPAQAVLGTYMQDPSSYTGLSTFFQQKRDLFRGLLSGSKWTVRPCTGTYFQLLGYEQFSDERDVDLALRLTREVGVASIPISPFVSDHRAHSDRALRFCFAKKDETLERAAERLTAVLG
ncbi:MAG: aminotransferase class I/II-fold pyridoxal phosphate-dependent enzyme [Ignavibacteria bacterium]|nr:aminotransferase class I/II-fold pyridoxal phosphate-dependent enzyme [Ignavibacteria bacterium]MBK7033314.1 aminotransferase class I/II-fold pyridoxal phosphate-dependent enzyme [Ignavibacteria bacterium]MBK7576694.1 aminotransferase class I/II-fold pyridoxal phosphate-dependent enzyme [Ignavibacteria bacterium]MBK9181685.1 aminotransferase class I/II-fold pyridoxal phosphate-dependent enzyme [Ignavibacteria bacterium]